MLKVFTAFSGYDSQCMALDRLGVDYDLVGWSEIDPHAIIAHNAVYPQYKDRNFNDITKIDWSTVPDFDLLTYSFPCFLKGTLIQTKGGLTPIEKISALIDEVFTHKRRYCKVLKFMEREYKGDILTVRGMMCGDINCTPNHPFYVRERYRKGHAGLRMFKEPEWVHAENLTKNHYLGFAVNDKETLPEWGGSIDNRWGHNKQVNHLQPLFEHGAFWYIMGRYIGDGWKKESKNGNGIVICCSDRNKVSLLQAIGELDWHYTISEEDTVTKVIICMNELCDFVNRYGYKAHGKFIDNETLDLPRPLLKRFLDGYLDSDGYFNGSEYKITTVSERLAYTLVQCVAKVHHRPARINKSIRPKKVVVEGRTCNQRDTYQIVWHSDNRKQDKAFYEDGYVWFPIREIKREHMETTVYNMEVEEDNSYTANGAIVHNCQDISSAGLKAGFGKDDGTRSSLLWECEKAIRAKKPMFLLMENVSALTHKGNMPGFRLWLDTLNDCGYNTYWKKLNSKDYGVAQNRSRVYAVSIRKDIDKGYDFPEPFELIKRLGDYLEDKVDDEYVVTQARKEGLAKSNAKEESRGNGFKFVPKTLDDIANTLTTLGTSRKTDTWIERPGQGLTKLTPREYFRLMGVKEDDIDKIMSSGLKKTHLFKLGGNSIVVDTLSKVLEPLMRNYGYLEPEDNIDKVNEEFYRLFNKIK